MYTLNDAAPYMEQTVRYSMAQDLFVVMISLPGVLQPDHACHVDLRSM